jgi:YVTN family beta-propeller protein
VIDVFAFKVIKTVPVGQQPSALAVNPKKNEIYVANAESNNISVIDAEKSVVVATIGVHRAPVSIAVTPDGKLAYVANSGSNNVSVLDLNARKVTTTITVGIGPAMAAMSPDGKTVVVSLHGESAAAIIDTTTGRERNKIGMAGCQQPESVTVLPDSSKAFIACRGSSHVAAVQLKKPEWKQDDDRLLTLLSVGKSPAHLALKPDGGEIFVSNADSGTFSEIATQANEVGGSYLVGSSPARGVVASDNATFYVTDSGADDVVIYDITVGRRVTKQSQSSPSPDPVNGSGVIHVGSKPESLVLSPNEDYLYVANTASADVSVVLLKAGGKAGPTLLTMLPVGKQPSAMVVKAFAVKR